MVVTDVSLHLVPFSETDSRTQRDGSVDLLPSWGGHGQTKIRFSGGKKTPGIPGRLLRVWKRGIWWWGRSGFSVDQCLGSILLELTNERAP